MVNTWIDITINRNLNFWKAIIMAILRFWIKEIKIFGDKINVICSNVNSMFVEKITIKKIRNPINPLRLLNL